jgi:hypothetical protein
MNLVVPAVCGESQKLTVLERRHAEDAGLAPIIAI